MIAVLHSKILHYREEFFSGLNNRNDIDIYCYENSDSITKKSLMNGNVVSKKIDNWKAGRFIVYDPRPLLSSEYDTLVLMLSFTHLTTWLLLITRPFHKKKIILWGHGISIKRFKKEEKNPNILLKYMIKLADGVWFYTEHELSIWKKIIPDLNAVSLNNSISGIEKILKETKLNKTDLKRKYGIEEPVILIFCARFTNKYRKTELLLQAVQELDPAKFGFIIIGNGELKPDFTPYDNVYDYGSLYDGDKKNELFQIADIYFQPAWVGLSIVEAMAYGKPVFTFERSYETLQCVEYSYLKHGYNCQIFSSFEEFIRVTELISPRELDMLGGNAREFAKSNLSMENMIDKADGLLHALRD